MMEHGITLKDLADALDKNEFAFYYQPKVSMLTGEVEGAEALIRWIKPDGSVILPDTFIPLAESTGFINEITLAMFERLVVDINIITDRHDSLKVSFNASAKDFYNQKFINAIHTALIHQLVTPEQLEIEITETVLINEAGDIRHSLETLQNLGVSIAMDDFGKGYSNIETLSKWPFSTIKLDQSLVLKLEESDKDLTIIQASIQMAHKLGLDVVAEGIESEAIYEKLQNAGCTQAQGFWMSKPVSLTDFLDLLGHGFRWPSQLVGLVHIAQLDHIQWRKAVVDTVYHLGSDCDHKHNSGMPESDPRKCRLGQWYYGVGTCFSGTEWYDRFEQPHNRLHEIGETLLEAARAGATGKTIITLMRELTEQSILLISMLQELENRLMSESVTTLYQAHEIH